jgi:hypothetical protein
LDMRDFILRFVAYILVNTIYLKMSGIGCTRLKWHIKYRRPNKMRYQVKHYEPSFNML